MWRDFAVKQLYHSVPWASSTAVAECENYACFCTDKPGLEINASSTYFAKFSVPEGRLLRAQSSIRCPAEGRSKGWMLCHLWKTLDMAHSQREGKEHHGLCVRGEGRAAAQHLNSGQKLNPQSNQINGNGEAICSQTPPAIFPTYRAAIECSSDIRVVVVGHLLIVGAQEADGFVIAVRGGIVPGYGLVAVISDVLVGRGAQQPEECHLYHSDGVPIRIHVGELWEVEKGKHWAVRGKAMHLGSFKDHQIFPIHPYPHVHEHPALCSGAGSPHPILLLPSLHGIEMLWFSCCDLMVS